MSVVQLDAETKAKLNGLTKQLEFRDENGATLGHFLPEEVYRKVVQAWLKTHWTDDEINRLDQQSGGSSLQEIWQRLGRK